MVLIIPDGVTTIGYAAFNNDRFSGSIIIPDSVTTIGGDSFRCCRGFNGIIEIGKGVREIGSCAFDNCTGLTGGLVIPGNVKKIGSGAFAWCTGLNGSLNLSEGLESIGQGAFSNSGLIGAINIPSTVKSIGEDPFPEGITSITVDDNSIFFKEVDNMLIEKDTGVLLTCAKQKTGRLIIPEGVISIANWAFINCTGIVGELAIPEGVEYIGDRAFEGCKLSGNLVFPRSVQRVGSWAFRGCIGVISITVYGYKTLLSSDAFSDHNPDLTMYGYEGSLAEKYASDNGIYFHKFALELNANNGIGNRIILYFRESSCSIPNNLFYRIGYGFCGWNTCADGSGTYYSDGYMFEKPACIELYAQWNKLSKSLWIPRQVERIEDETFFDTNAEFVILPTTCKEVGNLAFANCENLYQIYIQAIDIIIQDNAFSDSPHIVIVTKEGSNAVLFAMEHGIPVFVDE